MVPRKELVAPFPPPFLSWWLMNRELVWHLFLCSKQRKHQKHSQLLLTTAR